jgi:hypothetical protein
MANRSIIAGCSELKAKLRSLTRKNVKLSVGYQSEYAIYVHEDLTKNHKPPTQAKFLEEPAKLLRRHMQDFLKAKLRSGMKMEDALLLTGRLLLEASKQLVPVDTGNLRDSGFVELER